MVEVPGPFRYCEQHVQKHEEWKNRLHLRKYCELGQTKLNYCKKQPPKLQWFKTTKIYFSDTLFQAGRQWVLLHIVTQGPMRPLESEWKEGNLENQALAFFCLDLEVTHISSPQSPLTRSSHMAPTTYKLGRSGRKYMRENEYCVSITVCCILHLLKKIYFR